MWHLGKIEAWEEISQEVTARTWACHAEARRKSSQGTAETDGDLSVSGNVQGQVREMEHCFSLTDMNLEIQIISRLRLKDSIHSLEEILHIFSRKDHLPL